MKTSVEDLKQIHRKEEFDQKFKNKNYKNFELKEKVKTLFQSDHLPFANLVINIACKMPSAPKKPDFKIKLDNE